MSSACEGFDRNFAGVHLVVDAVEINRLSFFSVILV